MPPAPGPSVPATRSSARAAGTAGPGSRSWSWSSLSGPPHAASRRTLPVLIGDQATASFSQLRRLRSDGAAVKARRSRPRSGRRALTGAPADWNPPPREGHRPRAGRSATAPLGQPGPWSSWPPAGARVRARREAPRAVTRSPGRADTTGPQGRLLDPRKESPHRSRVQTSRVRIALRSWLEDQ